MTAAQAVDKLMASEHADVIRESVRFMVDELMEAEVVGADRRRVRRARAGAAQRRSATATATARWDTRVGAIELAIPKLRSGPGYFPSFLEPRRRAEQALVAVVQEAYVNGVSTRKVDRRRRAARGAHEQGPGVARCAARLDEQVAAFRERPLEGAYPYLWLDAKQEKVRDGAHVVSKAVVIAYGVPSRSGQALARDETHPSVLCPCRPRCEAKGDTCGFAASRRGGGGVAWRRQASTRRLS